MRTRYSILWVGVLALFLSSRGVVVAQTSSLVYEGPDGRLSYGKYANQGQTNIVNTVPDYSGAGYMGGGVPIPFVPASVIVTHDGPGDYKDRIQSAIDTVSAMPVGPNGFRGAVLLGPGEFNVGSSLEMTTSGVVLRGSGQQENGGTTIRYTATTQSDLIWVWGDSDAEYAAETRQDIAQSYVPVGSRSLNVANASVFAPGDHVRVRRKTNGQWIWDLGMWQYDWSYTDYKDVYNKVVTAVTGNTVYVDTPIVQAMEDLYGGGEIYRFRFTNRVNQCGIENMRMVSNYVGSQDEAHGWRAIAFSRAENCWVRQVTTKYFGYSAVHVLYYSENITVEDCAGLDPVSITTGERKYTFNIDLSQDILFQRCFTKGGRHDFVSGYLTPGPNVFVDSLATMVVTDCDAGPHHRYSTGQLYDNINCGWLRVQNRRDSGSGHGWAGAQTMFWNCVAKEMVCDSPVGAMNYSIGCKGVKGPAQWLPDEPDGIWQSHGTHVAPRSLYYRQLADRLGEGAVQSVTLPMQRDGIIWEQLDKWKGNGLFGEMVYVWATPTIVNIPENSTILHGVVRNLTLMDNGMTSAWEMVSGPLPVDIESPSSADTTVTFSKGGTYVFRFSAGNGMTNGTADITIAYRDGTLEVGATGAVNLRSTEAVLGGEFVVGGPADIHFVWDTTDRGENRAAWANSHVISNENDLSFEILVEGLTPDTQYFYRCFASNSTLTAWSGALSFVTAPPGDVTVFTQNISGTDSWNFDENWDKGIPVRAIDVVISNGVKAEVGNIAPLAYSGTLTLKTNAILEINNISNSQKVLTDAQHVFLEHGSRIHHDQAASWTLPPLTLHGNAYYGYNEFGAMQSRLVNFNNEIAGPGQFEIKGDNNFKAYLNTSNSIAGGFHFTANDGFWVYFGAAGSAGSGDVVVDGREDGRSAQLVWNAPNAMSDTAALYLNGKGNTADTLDRILLNASDTIAELYIDGVQLQAGTYGSTAEFVDNSSTGLLTVLHGPQVLDPITLIATGATLIGSHEAKLHGSLDVSGVADLYFLWDSTDRGTSFSSWASVSPVMVDRLTGTFSVSVTGLTPGTAYAYRCFASNALQSAWSEVSLFTTRALGVVTTFTERSSGTDSWNDARNWDNGIPVGSVDVVIGVGAKAQVENAATPYYTGTLTLQTNAILEVNNGAGSASLRVLQSATHLTMLQGSRIHHDLSATWSFPAMTIHGDVYYGMNEWPRMHGCKTYFNGIIDGTGRLELRGDNNFVAYFKKANSFTGGIHFTAQDRYTVYFEAAGSAGVGDVIVDPLTTGVYAGRSAQLIWNAADAMSDTATLHLNGKGYDVNTPDCITMNANDTINNLYLKNVAQVPKVYTGTASFIKTGSTGVLTVLNGPIPAPIILTYTAINIGCNTATMRGLMSRGVKGNATFCWGTVDGGRSSTSNWQNVVSVGEVNEFVTFTNTLFGLAPETTYYFNTHVTNVTAAAWGYSQSFKTAAAPPNRDLNGDGINDDWAARYFADNPLAGAATNDPDGDHADNLKEYIAGTNPTNGSETFKINLTYSNGLHVVSFATIGTTTNYYGGLVRYYAMEQLTNMMSTNWTVISGYGRVIGTGQTVLFTNSVPPSTLFFRAKTWLE